MSLSPIPKENFARQVSNSSLYDEDEEVAKLTKEAPTDLTTQRSTPSSTFMARSSVSSMSSSGTPFEPIRMESENSGFNSPEPIVASPLPSFDKTAYWENLYADYIDLFHLLSNGADTGAKGTWEDLEKMHALLEKHPGKLDLEPSYHPRLSSKISHSLKAFKSNKKSVYPDIFAIASGNEKKCEHKSEDGE